MPGFILLGLCYRNLWIETYGRNQGNHVTWKSYSQSNIAYELTQQLIILSAFYEAIFTLTCISSDLKC